MGVNFAITDVVELGIQIEKNGKAFYTTVALNSKNAGAKKLFEFLAAEEDRHIHTFERILKNVEETEPPAAQTEEYYEYLDALAGEHVFTKKDSGEGVAKSIKTDKEAIEKAISFEKDSIVLFDGMKKVVPVKDHKVIEELIAQEQMHLSKLLSIKKGF